MLPALATLTVLIYAVFDFTNDHINVDQIVSSGWLSSSFFLTAIAINYLTRKLKESEVIAEVESKAATRLETLNSLIIERMQTGVMICTNDGTIVSSNSSAKQLLELDAGDRRERHYCLSDIDKRLESIAADCRKLNLADSKNSAVRSTNSCLLYTSDAADES